VRETKSELKGLKMKKYYLIGFLLSVMEAGDIEAVWKL